MDFGDDSPSGPPTKKHKKHKKKHKHRKDHDSPSIMSPKTSIKLKLKLGSETMGTKSVMSVITEPPSEIQSHEEKPTKKGTTSKNDEEISDEEKWLDALEKGTLDTFASLGKKDPSLLTTRQKALLHGSQQDELLQLPSGYKSVELTEEQKQRRQEKAKRRRQQANEKIENDKNLTVNKLLKKQDSKMKRGGKGRGGKSSSAPRILYRNYMDGISINLPAEVPFPLVPQIAGPYPVAEMCGVENCQNKKTSVCSKTGVPVCGLKCYKRNQELAAASGSLREDSGGGKELSSGT